MADPAINPNTAAAFQISLKLSTGQVQEFNLTKEANPAFGASTIYKETVNGAGTSDSTFYTTNSELVNALLAASLASGTPAVQVRFGLNSVTSAWWSPWQDHLVTAFTAVPKSLGATDGYHVKLSTADALVKLMIAKKVAARKGRISDIVLGLAADNGLNGVVEPTVGTYNLIQSYQDDTSFISDRLILRALNSQGRGGYSFYLRDRDLHFHTLDFHAAVHAVNYFTSSTSVDLYQCDRSQLQLQRGAALVTAITQDPLAGETHVTNSDPARVMRLGTSTPELSKVKGANLNLLMHVGQNLGDHGNYAQARYEHEHRQLYELELLATKLPAIRAGDLVNLTLQPGSQPSPWSGYYGVRAVSHSFDNGKLMSRFTLWRGELNKSASTFNSAAVVDRSVLTSAADAPGQALNVAAVEATAAARGAESNTLKTVQPAG